MDLTVLVTGASGFIGGAISDRLIGRAEVRSLTSHPVKNRFGERVQSFAYDFDAPMRMEEAFRGVDVFVNSYYVFHAALDDGRIAADNDLVYFEAPRPRRGPPADLIILVVAGIAVSVIFLLARHALKREP